MKQSAVLPPACKVYLRLFDSYVAPTLVYTLRSIHLYKQFRIGNGRLQMLLSIQKYACASRTHPQLQGNLCMVVSPDTAPLCASTAHGARPTTAVPASAIPAHYTPPRLAFHDARPISEPCAVACAYPKMWLSGRSVSSSVHTVPRTTNNYTRANHQRLVQTLYQALMDRQVTYLN